MNHILSSLFANASITLPITKESKIVILSDLHMGSGGRSDDFAKNARLVHDALKKFYLPGGYILILNGDIEELLRNRLRDIEDAWEDIYGLFSEFRKAGRLYRLIGNHEIVPGPDGDVLRYDGESLRMEYEGKDILVFHGHQGDRLNCGRYNRAIGWVLRTFANYFAISNKSVAHDSVKKYQIEKRVYEFSRKAGILSIIGHTHRPLFESLSKAEAIGYRIERLCRKYPKADEAQRIRIRKTIEILRCEKNTKKEDRGTRIVDSLYGDIFNTTSIRVLFV